MKYEKHELADLFPPMTREERRELRENLKRNGQIDAIITFENKILEGWHRYTVCQELGITPQFINYLNTTPGFAGMHPADYVWAKNAERRHLDSSTKAALKVRYEIALGKRFLTHAEMSKRIGDKEKEEQAEKDKKVTAAVVGVAPSTVHHAMRLAVESPSKFNAVAAGRIPLHEAIKALPLTDRQKKNREERAERLRQGLTLSDPIRKLIRLAEKNDGAIYVELGNWGIQVRKVCRLEQNELDKLK
jgi:hypothetical protein